jgi:hypothetical protein
MSGYLGRMVAAAGAHKPSLHPFAGSIYENGAQSWAARPTSRGDADAAADPERHLVVEANDDGRETDVASRTPLVSQRAARDAQNPAAPVPGHAPLYSQRRDDRFAPASSPSSRISNPVERELTPPQATSAELAGEDRRASDRPGGRAAGGPQTAEASSRLLPLAPTVTRAPSATGGAAAIESIVTGPTGRDGASSSVVPRTADNPPRQIGRALTTAELATHAAPQRRSESLTREFLRGSGAQDQSVEIRIGRVEVLAVAPPAPGRPAASQNRTTSLADYLARRNGRT